MQVTHEMRSAVRARAAFERLDATRQSGTPYSAFADSEAHTSGKVYEVPPREINVDINEEVGQQLWPLHVASRYSKLRVTTPGWNVCLTGLRACHPCGETPDWADDVSSASVSYGSVHMPRVEASGFLIIISVQ